jgi:hypothetical protein
MNSKCLIIITVLCFSTILAAQPTITMDNHLIKAGDTLRASYASGAAVANFPALKAGANQKWDFSKVPFGQTLGELHPKADNPEYPTATYSIAGDAELGPIKFPVKSYFEKNKEGIFDLGFSNTTTKLPILAITGNQKDTLELPATNLKYRHTLYAYPNSFGSKNSSVANLQRPFILTVNNFGINKVPGLVKTKNKLTIETVAWGNLSIPDYKNKGKSVTYVALLQILTEESTDSIFLGGQQAPTALLQAFGLKQGQTTGYKLANFFVPGFKKYAIEASIDDNFKITRLVSPIESGFVGGFVADRDLAAAIETTVFPNPSQDGKFNIQLEKTVAPDWTLKIYDSKGSEIAQHNIQGEGKIQFDFQINPTSGTYFYALFDENQIFRTNGILINQ